MTREKVKAKEIASLLERHNKYNYPKLKSFDIIVPDNILDVLCQTQKRSKDQNKAIKTFRDETYCRMCEVSKSILKAQQDKAKKTRERKMENDPNYVKHFDIWINKSLPSSRISRANYAVIDKKSSVHNYKDVLYSSKHYGIKYLEIEIDEENEKIYYSDEWCQQHQRDCLQNFDINMSRFSSLDFIDFENALQKFVKGRHFVEITSLSDPLCQTDPYDTDDLCGFVYIMVLNSYKQAYIGITESCVCKRIQQHWKNKKAFDRLLWGSVETSVLSIDSFGPLDTTRIFVKPYSSKMKTPLEEYENKCIRAFDNRYLLNRLT